jgi:hypothetical protein
MPGPVHLLEKSHYREILDRTFIILNNIDNHLIQHPVSKLDKEVSNKIENAHLILSEAYQLTGQKLKKLDK